MPPMGPNAQSVPLPGSSIATRPFPRRSTIEWLPGILSGGVRIIDCVVLFVTAAAIHALYLGHAPWPEPRDFYLVAVVAAIMQFNVFHFWGIYPMRRLANLQFQFSSVPLASFVVFLSVVATLYLTKTSDWYSRGWMVLWSLATVAALLTVRLVLCPLAKRLVNRGVLAPRVAVVGCGRTAKRLIDYLAVSPQGNVNVVGVFDDLPFHRDYESGIAPDGTVDELCRRARHEGLDAIIIVLPHVSEGRLSGILAKLRSLPVDIRLCPDTLDYCMPQSSYEFLGVIPLLRLYDKPVSRWGRLGKEIEDKVLAALALILLAPVMAVIALLIKLDSPGPVVFKQKRYGFNNRLITVWKFRTMYHDQTDLDAERQTTRDDPRVTRIGHFLRGTSLDELPQIFNVLMGDMSLVGPRPHAVATKAAGELFENVVDEYAARHRVKPGITGWAQVNGWRGETDTVEKIRQRVRHDLHYIEHWSLLLDFKILIMTFLIVVRRVNAY